MTGHPDPDVLAEFREGLLGRRRSARIRAHLAGCSRCASVSGELAEVTELLARAPLPPVPEQLAARLDRVLAAESAARARSEAPAAAGQGAATDAVPAAAGGLSAVAGRGPGAGDRDSTSGQAGRRGLRRPAARSGRPRPWRATALRAASVAAAILVVAGGGYGVSRLVQGAASAPSGGTGASRAGAGPAAGGRRTHAHPGLRPNIALPTEGLQVIHSGTDYLPGRLAAQAKAVLARHRVSSAGPGTVTPATSQALQGCVRLVTGGTPPALVDVARYRGRPATIIVQAAGGGTARRVWVAGPGCSATRRDLITQTVLPASG